MSTISSPAALARLTTPSPTARPIPRLRLPSREFRVLILISLVLLMCLVDLLVTLNYVTSVGMAEANPLARWVMSFNCPWLLAGWKLLLMFANAVFLFIARRRLTGELGAWACFAIMLWLMARWQTYAEAAHIMPEYQSGGMATAEFVKFETSPD
ncbi:hypothetical protein BH11PLA1_BH11PLA1_23020 [soil metagenome]